MLAGHDPFSANTKNHEPMEIYANILSGRVKFPRNFNKKAKSLVKHLLVAE